MPVTININGLTLVHAGSEGYVHNTMPDVCMTPEEGVPLPFDNEAYSKDLANGTTTVFADGGNMIANLGSIFAKSIYDEGGSYGGVVSGTYMAEADFITHSFDVFFEGKPACRLTDKMWMNHRNTVSLGGECQKDLTDAEFEKWLCKLACECWDLHKPSGPEPLEQGQQYQTCLNKKIEAECYDGKYPMADSNVWREVPFDRGENWDMIESGTVPGMPTGNPIRGNSRRLDVVRRRNGGIEKIYDVKFPTDPTGNGKMGERRQKDYEKIAEKHTGDADNLEEFNVKDRCNGCGDPELVEQPKTVPSLAPVEVKEKRGGIDIFDVGVGLGVLVLLATGLGEIAAAAAAVWGLATLPSRP